MEILLIILGVIVLIGFVLLYSTFSWGLVLLKFWGWFLLPIFPMLPIITFWQALGLTFIISLFHSKNYTSIKDEFTEKTTSVVMMIIGPWITLLIGYIFYCIIN